MVLALLCILQDRAFLGASVFCRTSISPGTFVMIRKMCVDLEVLLGFPALAAPRNPNPRLGLLFPVSFELSTRVDA